MLIIRSNTAVIRRLAKLWSFIVGQEHYLGPWKSKASRIEYDRLIGEWLAAGRPQHLALESDATVVELSSLYWQFAKGYYVKDGRPTGIAGIKVALHWLKKYHGHASAAKFGPLALGELNCCQTIPCPD